MNFSDELSLKGDGLLLKKRLDTIRIRDKYFSFVGDERI